jgi:hypothetical protein
MIDVEHILESFKKLEEQGVNLQDCVLVDGSDGEMPANIEFIVMQRKDFQRNVKAEDSLL